MYFKLTSTSFCSLGSTHYLDVYLISFYEHFFFFKIIIETNFPRTLFPFLMGRICMVNCWLIDPHNGLTNCAKVANVFMWCTLTRWSDNLWSVLQMTQRIRSLKRQLNEAEEEASRKEAQYRHTQRELAEERETTSRLQKQLLDQHLQTKYELYCMHADGLLIAHNA